MKQFYRHFVFTFFLIIGSSFTDSFPPGSGLDSGVAIGKFLNGKLPSHSPNMEWEVVPAFPNLKFDDPLVITPHPTQNLLFVASRDGLVEYFTYDQNVATKKVFLDVRDRTTVVWDAGFLGFAFHPEFGQAGSPNRNYFYTYSSVVGPNGESGPFECGGTCFSCEDDANFFGGFLRLARYTATVNADGTLSADPDTELQLFNIRLYNGTHRGGGMDFGDDGFLYLALADQARFTTSQNIITNFDGGVIRIDVDQKGGNISHPPRRKMGVEAGESDEFTGVGYYIPNDNPWLDSQNGVFEEFYQIGNRNPHRMTKDRETGEFWIGEIGANRKEEVSIVRRGQNGGWPIYEGHSTGHLFSCGIQDLTMGPGTYNPPVVDFTRRETNAIIGGYVYRGTKFPDLYGKYLCAGHVQNRMFLVEQGTDGNYTKEHFANFSPGGIMTFGEGPDGELFMGRRNDNTPLYTLRKNTNNNNSAPILLSETGVFSDLVNLVPSPGVIPYEMIEPFWSDGAEKFRWIAIPNNGTHDNSNEQARIDNGDWVFPRGTVTIKHIELGGKRLETRLQVNDETNTHYYLTYKWNEQGTDAIRLDDALYEEVMVNGQPQIWHYPSNSECLVCHQQSVGSVLGLKTRYLNKEITYPTTGRTANQLVTLSSIGALRDNITENSAENILTIAAKDDLSQSLEKRARSYLDVNCSYCHQPGTANRAIFDARFITPLAEQNYINGSIMESLELNDARLIIPNQVNRSMIHFRANSLGEGIAMPPLTKNKVDIAGVQLIEDWINSLPPDPDTNPTPDYCASSGLNGTAEFIENISLGNINNTSGSNGGYADFSAISTPLAANQTYPITLVPVFTGTAYSESWNIWIDFNKNGSFEDVGEKVFSQQSMTTINGNLSTPDFTTSGTTRMRISMKYNNMATSCENFQYGEVEDYTIILVSNAGCTMIGNSCDDGDDCTVNDMYDTSCNCIGILQDVDDDGICDDFDQCPDRDDSLIGTPCNDNNNCTINDVYDNACNCIGVLQDSDGDGICDANDPCPNDPTNNCGVNSPNYCASQGNSTDYEYIEGVLIGTINNQSGNNNGYFDFTSLSTTFNANQSYSVTLTPGYVGSSSYAEYWSIWIDFNKDGNFSDAEERVVNTEGITGVATATINIPNISQAGMTRMRVSMRYNDSPNSCGSFGSGEVEDYSVVLNNGGGCTTVGNVCDDGNPCTTNDLYDINCNCAGIIQDSDGDSVCDANDPCPNDATNACNVGNYCTASGSNVNYEYIKQVNLGSINNVSGTDGGYADFTALSTTIMPNQTYAITLVPGFVNQPANEHWTIWIDFNQDGSFDEVGEQILSQTSNGTINQQISIPDFSNLGATRMRVSMQWNGATTACQTFTYGEVEDYTILLANNMDCNMVGNSCNDNNVCTINDVYDANCNCVGNLQDSDGDGVCDTNDPCPNDFSNNCGTTGTLDYCEAKGNSVAYEHIENVSLGSINNTSGKNGGYGDFTDLSTNLVIGQSYPITLTPGFSQSPANEYWKVWIDFNQDGSFNGVGEEVFSSENNNSIAAETINIPSNLPSRITRMRIAIRYNSNPSSCGSFQYGEVEDYTVNLTTVGFSSTSSNSNFRIKSNNTIPKVTDRTYISIYPNPAKDEVYISMNPLIEFKKEIVIFNQFGQIIQKLVKEEITHSTISINTKGIMNGLYYVKLQTVENKNIVQKLMIHKLK